MKIIRSAVRIQQLLEENERLSNELALAQAKIRELCEEIEDYDDTVAGLQGIIEDMKDNHAV